MRRNGDRDRSACLAQTNSDDQFEEESVGAMHSLRSLIAFTAILIAAASHTKGAAVDAKSAELGDVKSAIATAREGDTVTVAGRNGELDLRARYRKGRYVAGSDKHQW